MLDSKPDLTLGDKVRDIDSIERDDITHYMTKHELSNLDVLAGPGVLEWRKISPDQVRRLVALLEQRYDTTVLHTSGLLNELAQLAVEGATTVFWITTT